MKENLSERIERAKELLHSVRHVPISTVNEDGSPHLSPVFAALDDELNMYWASNPKTTHSCNVIRDGRVFLVLFDSMEKGGGLYIKARAHEARGDVFERGLKAFNEKRQKLLKETVPREKFGEGAAQRLYHAEPITFWVNMASRDADGNVLEDKRYEVGLEELIS